MQSPIDIERIDRESNQAWSGIPLREGRKNVIAIDALSDEKGHRFLIEAIAAYQRSASLDATPPIDLHLVGDGVLRRELESLAASLDWTMSSSMVTFPAPLLY